MEEVPDDGLEGKTRDSMIWQLRRNLSKCRKVLLDEKLDLKTRERWTQLYNNTATVLNQVLRDRQMRDWERRVRIIQDYRKAQHEALMNQYAPTDPENKN